MASVSRAVFLTLAAALVLGCARAPEASPLIAAAGDNPDAGRTAAPIPTASQSPAVDMDAAGAVAFDASFGVASLVIAGGKAWIAGFGEGIGVLDATGRLSRSVPVDQPCAGMDTGFRAIWTVTCGAAGIVRIDAGSGRVESAALDDPIVNGTASIGAGEGAVWLVAGAASDQLLGIDPETLKVTSRYPIAPGGAGVRAGFGGVWVTRPSADEILRVDATSGQSVSIHVPGAPRSLAIGAGAVWVLGGLGTVTRLDPATNGIAATIRLGPSRDDDAIAVGGGRVWIHGRSQLLTAIDAKTNRVVDRYGPPSGAGSVAAASDAVWVTSPDTATIWRLPLH